MATGDDYKLTGQVKVSDAEAREHQATLYAKRVTNVPTDMQMQIDYVGGSNPIYVGYGAKGLATSSSGWVIQKFTWDVNDNCTSRQIAFGIYDNRTALTYE